ncbi:site-specific integrase [Pseudonocardia halophobica]|uniref:Phage integrase n=1 Tax=Pseudonocardia halophobica TaxID=29401 RepID=A0A9W6UFQ2_9PSEU|nr:tyrosine-type recombinase/integrase [Pseudonocardia halophobica]GLL15519.1 phage integrase [Pseudonocardia halophobica]
MGRPAMPLGTYSSIRTYDRGGVWWARTLFRDWDGVTRQVQRNGPTENAAKRALTEALRDRVRIDGGAEITPDSRVDALAEAWWSEINDGAKSPGTLRAYRDRLDRQVKPSLGSLRVRELSTGVVDRHLKAVRERHGVAVTKLVRTVLSGMCTLALRHDALERNPVRDAPRISGTPKKDPVALTAAQARQLRALLTYDEVAVRRDIPDLVSAMFATGLRIGEICALDWDDVDLESGTVRTGGMVVRERGKGLRVRRDPSSKVKGRRLRLPTWAVEMLRRRRPHDTTSEPLVFPAAKGGLRDPSNTQADLKEALIASGYEWVTSHVFRKTVASMMDGAGLSSRAAADQLGHAKPSMTSDRYYGRAILDTGAADVLEDLG